MSKKISDPDYNYIVEVEESLVELNEKKSELSEKVDRLKFVIKGTTLMSDPENDITINPVSVFSSEADWDGIKYHVHRKWKNPFNHRRLMNRSASSDLWFFVSVCVYALMLLTMLFEVHSLLGLHWTYYCLGVCIAWELVCGTISTSYYVIIPNILNKKYWKKELKKLNAQLKLLESEISTKQSLVDTYKLSTINPNQMFNSVKEKTIEQLRAMVASSRKNTLPNIHESIRDTYTTILDKCDVILGYAETNGTIVSKVSKVYNIYLNEVDELLIKNKGSVGIEVVDLLNNFDKYLDRKISVFKDADDLINKIDISALNRVFLEED